MSDERAFIERVELADTEKLSSILERPIVAEEHVAAAKKGRAPKKAKTKKSAAKKRAASEGARRR